MAAILKGVYQHGDLMRLSIATPGNDFRLGACEAPPAIVSTHLGEEMTRYLQGYAGKRWISFMLLCICILQCVHLLLHGLDIFCVFKFLFYFIHLYTHFVI